MSTVTSKDGTKIAYGKVGSGPPVVVVDGAFVYRSPIDPWTPEFASLLAETHTVYTFERRGRGRSGDTQPYAIQREVEDIGALIEEAGGSAFVVGLSSGAVLSLDAAAAGLPIEKLAVYEAPFIVDDTHAPRPDDYVAQAQKLVDEGRKSDAVVYALTRTVFLPEEMVEGMRSQPFWPLMEAVGGTVPYDGRIMDGLMSGKPLPEDRWSATTVPTLVMYGAASEQWMRNAARALYEVHPTAVDVQGLDGQTHEVDPKVLTEHVTKFFAAE